MILTVTNTKGGVAKTTTSIELAAGLARGTPSRPPLRTLLVDADPQASATFGVGLQLAEGRDLAAVSLDGMSLMDAVVPTYLEGLSLLPGAEAMSGVAWGSIPMDLRAFRNLFKPHIGPSFDAIVIDAPNALAGTLALAAMVAADAYIVPASPKFFDLRGLNTMIAMTDQMKVGLEEQGVSFPDRLGVLLTLYDTRSTNSRGFAEQARAFIDDVFTTVIRRYVDIERAPGLGKSVVDQFPGTPAAQDMTEFVTETVARANLRGYLR